MKTRRSLQRIMDGIYTACLVVLYATLALLVAGLGVTAQQ
jgi:hypothetical protein